MRRHLGFSVDEWRALPWWQTRLYEEGLLHEFTAQPEQVLTEDGEVAEVVALESLGVSWR